MGSAKGVLSQVDVNCVQANFTHHFHSFIVFAITCRITKMFSIYVKLLHLGLIINCIEDFK